MNIPQDLLSEYKQGRVLIFIGQGINGDEWAQLGTLLSDQLQDNSLHDLPTTDVAEEYEIAFGRNALIRKIRDFCEKHSHIHQNYHSLASLTATKLLVTTCLDDRLERAFADAGRTLNVIVSQVDRAYGGSANDARLYKLHGTLSQAESIKISLQDLRTIYYDEKGISTALKGHLADNTILFIGFALDELLFQQLYLASIAPLDRHIRRAYALGGPYSRKVQRFCDRNQITLLRNEPADFFASFLDALQKQPDADGLPSKTASRSISPGKRPYKKLFAYGPEDEELFFGRRREIERILSLIQAYRLVVLHGPSGIGKSSLLGAGVTPYVTNNEYKVIIIKAEGKELPDQLIRREIMSLLPHSEPIDDESPLVDYLSRACDLFNAPLVILLDQFEDFFIHLEAETRTAFTHELAQTLRQRSLPVKWLLSIRSEWYSELSEMKEEIPDIFKAEFRIPSLALPEVRKAIERPAQNVGMDIEPVLVDRLLEDLGPGPISLPQLQLVCDALYDSAHSADTAQLQLAQYETLGGAEGILTNYLNDFLRRYSTEQAAHIRNILSAFVTSEGTAVPLSLKELTQETHLMKDSLRPLLHELESERFISEIERGTGQAFAYQLAHSYLVSTLAEDPEIRRQKAIHELLEQEIRNWEKIRSLMSREKLGFLRDQVGQMELSEDAKELIFRSAIQNNEDIEYWIDRIHSEDICTHVIREHLTPGQLKEPCPLAALSAISSLETEDPFKSLLANIAFAPSFEPEVRHEAAVSLHHSHREYFLATIESVLDVSPENRKIVLEVIAGVQAIDRKIVSGQLARFKLKWPLRRLRLKGNHLQRNTIVFWVTLGGMLGAGLGAFLGGLFSNIPLRLISGSTLKAVWHGVLIGGGTGLGIGTVEAAGEHALSAFYILTVMLEAGIIHMFLGTISLGSPQRQVLIMTINLIIGMLSGISLSMIVHLTRKMTQPTRRFVLRVVLGLCSGFLIGGGFVLQAQLGLYFFRNLQGEKVIIDAAYGLGLGLGLMGCMAISLEFIDRRLQKTISITYKENNHHDL